MLDASDKGTQEPGGGNAAQYSAWLVRRYGTITAMGLRRSVHVQRSIGRAICCLTPSSVLRHGITE